MEGVYWGRGRVSRADDTDEVAFDGVAGVGGFEEAVAEGLGDPLVGGVDDATVVLPGISLSDQMLWNLLLKGNLIFCLMLQEVKNLLHPLLMFLPEWLCFILILWVIIRTDGIAYNLWEQRVRVQLLQIKKLIP